jgi:hypothetical protein
MPKTERLLVAGASHEVGQIRGLLQSGRFVHVHHVPCRVIRRFNIGSQLVRDCQVREHVFGPEVRRRRLASHA